MSRVNDDKMSYLQDNGPCSSDRQDTPQTATTSRLAVSSPIETFSTPNRMEKLAQILSPETGGEGVPTPFKKTLFWPGTPPKKSSAKARKSLKLNYLL